MVEREFVALAGTLVTGEAAAADALSRARRISSAATDEADRALLRAIKRMFDS
jgi:hypothetical protein